jgi:hypothetical protein
VRAAPTPPLLVASTPLSARAYAASPFRTSDDYALRVLVAAGDKPHLCNACGTRYLRKGSLNHSANRRNSLHKVQHKAVTHAAAMAA